MNVMTYDEYKSFNLKLFDERQQPELVIVQEEDSSGYTLWLAGVEEIPYPICSSTIFKSPEQAEEAAKEL